MTIFKNQDNILLNIETGMDLTGANVHQILYEKPNTKKGFWNANIVGTKLTYQPTINDFDKDGTWLLQAYIVKNGLDGYGEIISLLVLNNLK